MKLEFVTTDKNVIEEVHRFIEEWNSPENYIITQTSGSTGKPKSIKIDKKHMAASAMMTSDFLNLKKDFNCLLCLSPKTIGGKMMIVRAIVLEMNLIVSDNSSTPLKNINQHIHFAAMVPLQVEKSIIESSNKLKKINKLIIGGGSISNTLSSKIIELSLSAYQTFGMTETISHIAMREIIAEENIYKTLKNISISKNNDTLTISAPLLGIEGLTTNDIIEIIDDETFKWIGRNDFVINSGGVKIHPEEVEFKLSKIIQLPFFVTGVPDTLLGEKLILCIETIESFFINKEELTQLLPMYHVPKEIYFFSKFTRTESAKINKQETLINLSDAKKQVL